MRTRAGAVFLLSVLFLSLLVVPVAGAADGGKALVKEMVQAPGEYSVGVIPGVQYMIPVYRYYMGGWDELLRQHMLNWRLLRLLAPQ